MVDHWDMEEVIMSDSQKEAYDQLHQELLKKIRPEQKAYLDVYFGKDAGYEDDKMAALNFLAHHQVDDDMTEAICKLMIQQNISHYLGHEQEHQRLQEQYKDLQTIDAAMGARLGSNIASDSPKMADLVKVKHDRAE